MFLRCVSPLLLPDDDCETYPTLYEILDVADELVERESDEMLVFVLSLLTTLVLSLSLEGFGRSGPVWR
jgi:predicted small lipoprotein YifL